MNKNICNQLWVIRFCLKVVYPKFNYYAFLVFLAIKYRIRYRKKHQWKNMNNFAIKTIPAYIQRLLAQDYLEYNLPIVMHKCILLSREEFIQLSSENLFYIDNGVLWLALKLTPKLRKNYEHKSNAKCLNSFKNSLDFVTSEIHKKLFSETIHTQNKLERVRIVPVVGSKSVKEDIALTTEQEYSNIVSTFGLSNYDDIKVSFHPVPSFDCTPKIAAVAEVSLVNNEYDVSNDFLKEVLSNYFEVPKLLSENDIFSIDLTPNITTKYHYKYLDLIENAAKLYFKCRKICEGDVLHSDEELNDNIIKPYFIVKGVTQLSLGENLHLVKPKDEYYIPKDMSHTNLQILNLCPTGLKQIFNQMQEAISPFITGDMNELSSSLSSPIIPFLLLTGLTGSGKHTLVKILAKFNGMNCMSVDCNALQSSTAKQTESKINSTIQKSKAAAPVIVSLDNFEVFAVDPENNEDCRVMEYFINIITDLYQNYTKYPIIFIALTEKLDLKPNILRLFLEKTHIPRLNAEQRFKMLQWFVSVMQLSIDGESFMSKGNDFIDVDNDILLSKHCQDVLQRVAAKTETFMYGDLDTVLHFAMRESFFKQQTNYLQSNPDLCVVREEDFNSALESIRSLQSQHLDAPKIPKVYWEDIGGLEKLKKELLKTIEFPIKYPHLFKNSSLKRSGILLYGPPGCGKTLVAKAVSTELNVSFLSVKGPELLNMYIGQSEENVRKVFESARASSPCIVFLDELDALAPRRGAAGDSGGASDRVVSQLLAEVDGVACGEDAETSSFVFIMGATNRPDLLEQSLLRPGRLDKLIYVGPYSGLYEKTSVLKALCRNYKLKEEVCLEDIAAALPERCTGADLLAVVDAARSAAIRGLIHDLEAGLVKESEFSQDSVILGVSELWQGVELFRPSVTDEELAYYESLQTQM